MTVRLLARAVLAFALFVPVVTMAAPGRLTQSAPVRPASVLSVTIDPLDPQHTRIAFTLESGETAIYDAKSVSMTYASDGLAFDVNGPGTFTFRGQVASLGRARLIYKDGHFLQMGGSLAR
jgi:hypothetical protein